MRELAEAPAVTAFRARFEAGRSFDLDDDLEFCPGLLTEDDVCDRRIFNPFILSTPLKIGISNVESYWDGLLTIISSCTPFTPPPTAPLSLVAPRTPHLCSTKSSRCSR
jgi:hypothetical protein